MTKSSTYQSAQIGVIAVLLTTVLLAIGISISTRVVEQTQQELSRQESAQQFQQAESGADMGSQMTDPGGGTSPIDGTAVTDSNSSTTPMAQGTRQETFSSDIDTVYLLQGDTVELLYTAELGNGVISWELAENNTATTLDCSQRPSLLITVINGGGDKKVILPFRPISGLGGATNCTGAGSNVAGYFPSTDTVSNYDPTYNYTKYKSFVDFDIDGFGDPLTTLIGQIPTPVNTAGLKVRIEALYAPTYVYLPGLTSTTRSVSSNQVGNESRVVEQNTTELAPSYVTDFTIFAGNSRICQGDNISGCN